MSTRRRNAGRVVWFRKECAAVFLAAFFLLSAQPSAAANMRVVKGIVGTVSGNHIFLKGKSVDLTGVPVRNPSGRNLSVREISPGRKVALHYRRGSLASVIVYDPMVE